MGAGTHLTGIPPRARMTARARLTSMSRGALAIPAAFAIAIGTAIPAVALDGARTASTHTVTLKNLRFRPGTLTIARGDTVTWQWRDREEHNVTFRGLRSRTMTHGSFTVRFARSGAFAYRCTIHASEGMKGKIIVR
jgi:plastocyanin